MDRLRTRLSQYQWEDLQFGMGAAVLIGLQFITPDLLRIVLLVALLALSIPFNYRATATIGKFVYFIFLFGGFANLILITIIPSQPVAFALFGPIVDGTTARAILAAMDLVWAHMVVAAGRHIINQRDCLTAEADTRLDALDTIANRAAGTDG